MNAKPVSEAKTKDFQYVQAALDRAAERAREIAQQTNTPLVLSREGKLVKVLVD